MAKSKSIEQLIREKTDRLESIPDGMLSKLEKLQKDIFPVVVDLISTLQRDSEGFILFSKTNLAISENIRSQLRAALLNSEYVEIVADFADEFDIQATVTDSYLAKVFPEFVSGGIASDIVKQSKKTAVEIFINGITDEAFADAISKQVTLAVNNNASFTETFKNIREIVTGNDEVDGKIQQYAQQVAHDQFALADRAYTSQVSEELKAVWFYYSGSQIKTTRPFCAERHNRYFYYKEIELWGEGKKTEGLSLPQKNGDWSGKIEGTNSKTIFTNAGGWNCRHSIIPVSIFIVPKEVIQRNIQEGFFKPSEFEKRELGL
jgi:hypothetical protein